MDIFTLKIIFHLSENSDRTDPPIPFLTKAENLSSPALYDWAACLRLWCPALTSHPHWWPQLCPWSLRLQPKGQDSAFVLQLQNSPEPFLYLLGWPSVKTQPAWHCTAQSTGLGPAQCLSCVLSHLQKTPMTYRWLLGFDQCIQLSHPDCDTAGPGEQLGDTLQCPASHFAH